VLDVGSGGGLPAVVVAICLPDLHVTALEPIHKKHAFLRTAARELALPGLEPLAERIEAHRRDTYAAAMSRATLDLRDWLLLGLRHVAPGGIVFGFEAIPRDDLPPGALRHPYLHLGRPRAIIALPREASPTR
jgi:16S rRNA (guanine527-N7)-methyltransferase